MESWGNRLRQARNKKDLTQAQLAELVAHGQSAVGQWETGQTQPKLDVIEKLAGALDVTAPWLAFGHVCTGPNDSADCLDRNTVRTFAIALANLVMRRKLLIPPDRFARYLIGMSEAYVGATEDEVAKIVETADRPS